jgi:hypothetical protein
MRLLSLIKYYVILVVVFISYESIAGVREALRFAREGIERAIELAPRVSKRKSFDSRSFYPGEVKIFYKVSMKRDTSDNDIIIKSVGYSELDEAVFEIKASKFERVKVLENAILSAWEMLNKKGFLKSDKKTDKVEIKIEDYAVTINVKFEGPSEADVKIAKIKIEVSRLNEKFESGKLETIRKYKVSNGSFI